MNTRVPIIATALVVLAALAQPASAQSRIKIGTLSCDVSSGLGLVVTSSRDMQCLYTSAGHGFKERYSGTIRKFGLDIGQTNAGVLEWAVFAPTAGPRRGALAGDYVGADASVTVGAGLGANALVGGFQNSIALQPLSVEVQTGFALAAGVAALTLRAAQ